MNPTAALKDRADRILRKRREESVEDFSTRPNVLIAAIDSNICSELKELFQDFSINTVWLKGVEAAKSLLARQKISACLCGFWLQDGTYRELVRHIRRERSNIPVIIVSAPFCSDEYRSYLSAMNLGALDFLPYPYRKSELEKMLSLTLGSHPGQVNQISLVDSGEAA